MSSLLFIGVNNHQNMASSPEQNNQQPEKEQNIRIQRQRQIKSNKLLIDPEYVIFNYQMQKTSVSKLILKNDYSYKISFKIIQPKKSTLNVKSKKFVLNSKQSIEIFVFFNGQHEKLLIQDQFLIILERQKNKLHVPITCKPKIFRMSHPRMSLHKNTPLKQTENTHKQKLKPKLLTIKKTKLELDQNCSVDGLINNFMQKYNLIHEFVKQKNVKKQIFIGQKALTQEKQFKIIKFNEQIKSFIQSKIRKKVETRLSAEYSEEGPVVRNFQGLILRWNKQKNIPRMIYQKGLGKVQEEVRKYLVNLRFQKIHRIFSLYRQFQNSNEHSNLPVHKKHQIYIQKLQKKLNKKSQINLELVFDRNSIIPMQIQLQYQKYCANKKQQFEINPRIGFDNWVAIQQSIPYTHEIMNYSKKQMIPEWMCHPKLVNAHEQGILGGRGINFNQIQITGMQRKIQMPDETRQNEINCSQFHEIFDCLKIKQPIQFYNMTDQTQQKVFLSKSNSSLRAEQAIPPKGSLIHRNEKLKQKDVNLTSNQRQQVQQLYKKSVKNNKNLGNNFIHNKNNISLNNSEYGSKNAQTTGFQPITTKKDQNLEVENTKNSINLNKNEINEDQIQKVEYSNIKIGKRFFMITMTDGYQISKGKAFRPYLRQTVEHQLMEYCSEELIQRNIFSYQNSKNQSKSKQSPFSSNKYSPPSPALRNNKVMSGSSLSNAELISRQRYNSDALNNINFPKQQLQSFKEGPNQYFVDSLMPYKNSIIRKVYKQDRYQFDRLDKKAQRILSWIEQNQKQGDLYNYKLKKQFDLEIPPKNKIKKYGDPTLYERNLQNINDYKESLLGKSQCLESSLYQFAKVKQNTIFRE